MHIDYILNKLTNHSLLCTYIFFYLMLQNCIRVANIMSKISTLCRATFHKNINFRPITRNMFVKNMHEYLNRAPNRTNFKAEQRFKLWDNISNDYKLIFREQRAMSMTFVVAYNLGWIGSLFIAPLTIAYVIIKDPPVGEEKLQGIFGPIKPINKTGRKIMMWTGFVMFVSLIVVGKILPIRIYHDPNKKLYKAVFAGILHKKNILTFSEGTAVPKFKYFLKDHLFDINGRTVLLEEEDYLVPFVREQMIRKTN